MYDSFVSRRNAKVIGAAVRSGAIVSSLFPSVVKERLYKEAEEKQMQAKRLLNGHGSAKWLSADHVEDGMDAESQSCLPYQEKPIVRIKFAPSNQRCMLCSFMLIFLFSIRTG